MAEHEKYIHISEFMITELNLKGNELLIYAIIYGFSQDGNSFFSGSLAYLEKWTNSTKPGVLKALKKLQEKGLILKFYNSGFPVYKAVNKVDNETKFTESGKQSLPKEETKFTESGKQSLPNILSNTLGYTKEYNTSPKNQKYICKESQELCERLVNYCKRDNPNFKTNKIDKWTNEIGKIHFLDGYEWTDIQKIIDFAKNDDFWNSNILSGEKLRKQMEKLYLKAKNSQQPTKSNWYDPRNIGKAESDRMPEDFTMPF